ncbi:hypothetical protein BX600DRAFT_509902 [Xylariales sp. PMI_506]|nr:hypothetical protein BX600DRAFT_509902 [Xylariales sp. PMI_506]
MAIGASRPSSDNDQQGCWESQGQSHVPTNDFFLDQYDTYDPRELLINPETPSALLDSLQGELREPLGDSNCLRGEEYPTETISFAAPRYVYDSAPGSAPILAGADTTLSLSPCATLRASPAPTTGNFLVETLSTMNPPAGGVYGLKTEPAEVGMLPVRLTPSWSPEASHDPYAGETDAENFTGSNILPLSPPSSGIMTALNPESDDVFFSSAVMKDVIFDEFASRQAYSSHNNPITPLATPDVDVITLSGGQGQGQGQFCNDDSLTQSDFVQQNMSSAEWPTEGLIKVDSSCWSSTSYASNPEHMDIAGKWEDITDASNLGLSQAVNYNGPLSGDQTVMMNEINFLDLSFPCADDISELMVQITPQTEQPSDATLFDANTPNSFLSTPPTQIYCTDSQVVGNSISSSYCPLTTTPTMTEAGYSSCFSAQSLVQTQSQRQRRPKARHSNFRESATSPLPRRSRSTARRCTSRRLGFYSRRDDSPSPSPSPSSVSSRARRRTASQLGSISTPGAYLASAIDTRKQAERSWSSLASRRQHSGAPGREQQRVSAESLIKAQPARSYSSSLSSSPMLTSPPSSSLTTRCASGCGGAGSREASAVGFVNLTPSDSTILMTGVAPSGSSKTKARREKEAAERRKRLNEAAIEAVRAAGGDIEKLAQEGFAV